MLHYRSDLDGVDAWPNKRPHLALRVDPVSGETYLMDYSASPSIPEEEARPVIPLGEPVFLFRANDRLVPRLAAFYEELLMEAGAEKELVDAISKHRQRVVAYAAEHYDGGHVPDVDKGWLR